MNLQPRGDGPSMDERQKWRFPSIRAAHNNTPNAPGKNGILFYSACAGELLSDISRGIHRRSSTEGDCVLIVANYANVIP